ncbi:MAG TPA: type I-E CRISPR-associated protein Cse2/CasB [Streptomyces sp.]
MSPHPPPSELLGQWLTGLMTRRDYGSLAALRRPGAVTSARVEAGCHAPRDDDLRREVFEQVAFLFAIYHQGADRPHKGYGSLGAAARRIGGGLGRGPDDPGAVRLMDRIVASRPLPVRHLRHAVARLRSCEMPPPSWPRLADDLADWRDRTARVPYRWAVDFHTPPPKKGTDLT